MQYIFISLKLSKKGSLRPRMVVDQEPSELNCRQNSRTIFEH